MTEARTECQPSFVAKKGRKPTRKFNEFGRRLRKWVIDRGTTNAQLAEDAGVDPSALSRWAYLEEEPGIRKVADRAA